MLPESVAFSNHVATAKRCREKAVMCITAYITETCNVAESVVKSRVLSWIRTHGSIVPGRIPGASIEDTVLRSSCLFLTVSNLDTTNNSLKTTRMPLSVEGLKTNTAALPLLVFQCDIQVEVQVMYDGYVVDDDTPDDEDGGLNLPPYRLWHLPNKDLLGVWESLIFDTNVKESLLNFTSTGLHFSNCGVDPSLITWNRLVLLHGPPGTGKTSLAKSLSQQLSLTLREQFHRACLIEVNAHSLFSKWFSESGKLVANLFTHVREILMGEDVPLVCILIDEVESLTGARAAAMNGCEPSDAIRVVNSLLTQIDSLKTYGNVMLLATTNLLDVLDPAFVDRADLCLEIPLPGPVCRLCILQGCINELIEKKVVVSNEDVPLNHKLAHQDCTSEVAHVKQLDDLIRVTEGLSGRALRKLPFQTFCVNFQTASFTSSPSQPTVEQYCIALMDTAESQRKL